MADVSGEGLSERRNRVGCGLLVVVLILTGLALVLAMRTTAPQPVETEQPAAPALMPGPYPRALGATAMFG